MTNEPTNQTLTAAEDATDNPPLLNKKQKKQVKLLRHKEDVQKLIDHNSQGKRKDTDNERQYDDQNRILSIENGLLKLIKIGKIDIHHDVQRQSDIVIDLVGVKRRGREVWDENKSLGFQKNNLFLVIMRYLYLHCSISTESFPDVETAILAIAKVNKRNHVLDYFLLREKEFRAEMVKDPGLRSPLDMLVRDVLMREANAEGDEELIIYVKDIIGKTLMATVRRAKNEDPDGVKFDYCPVLEGLQDLGKSSFLSDLHNFLAGYCLVVTTPIFESVNASSKDSFEKAFGSLCVENQEMTGSPKKIKAFLSSATDRWRQAYGRVAGYYPRSYMVWCTTNQNDYLVDITGNRRFYPIPLLSIWGGTSPDIARTRPVIKLRDKLWGEMAVRESEEESIEPTRQSKQYAETLTNRKTKAHAIDDSVEHYLETLGPINPPFTSWRGMRLWLTNKESGGALNTITNFQFNDIKLFMMQKGYYFHKDRLPSDVEGHKGTRGTKGLFVLKELLKPKTIQKIQHDEPGIYGVNGMITDARTSPRSPTADSTIQEDYKDIPF